MSPHTHTDSTSRSLSLMLKEAIEAVPFKLPPTLALIKDWSQACRDEGLTVNQQFLKQEGSGFFFLWPQYAAFIFMQQQKAFSQRLQGPSSSHETLLRPALGSPGLTEEDTKALIQAFWREGFNVNDTLNDSYPESLLSFSARHGLLGLAQFITEQGGNVHYAARERMTIFNYAFFNGHLEITEYLLGHGARINNTNAFGATPLIRASNYENSEQIHWLLSHGADILCHDQQGHTPLHHAISRHRLDLVQLFLAAEADLRVKNSLLQNALDFALDLGRHEIADYLKAVKLARAERDILTRLIKPAALTPATPKASCVASTALTDPTNPLDPSDPSCSPGSSEQPKNRSARKTL